jgi:hypothetical protein
MAGEREIKAKEIVRDINSGIGDNELMHKYRLTFKGLQSVYKRLVKANLIDETLLEGRIAPQLTTETTIITRLPRQQMYMPLPVQDVSNPDERGIVTDLSERGLGVKGLKIEIDEVRELIIRPDKFFNLSPFSFKAKCRWTKTEDEGQEILAGFEIVSIAGKDLEGLKDLIHTLEYMYR